MEDYDSPERRLSLASTWDNNNGPTTVNECSHFLTCDTCNAPNLRGPLGEPIKEVSEDVTSGYSELERTAAGRHGTSTAEITDETSTPALERCGHFVNLHDVVNTCTQCRSWRKSPEATSSTEGKRNTYPPLGETRHRTKKFWPLLETAERSRPAAEPTVGAGSCRGVVILRGYRDIMTMIHPSYCEAPECQSTGRVLEDGADSEVASSADSQGSASSAGDCPPWLPESELSNQRTPVVAESAARHQCLPLTTEEEAGDSSPVVEFQRGAIRFIRRPADHQASRGAPPSYNGQSSTAKFQSVTQTETALKCVSDQLTPQT